MKNNQKNTLQQRSRAMIIMLVMIIFILFLVNFISAFNWNDGRIVAYYDFNAGSGTVLDDLAGHDHNGTLVNTPAWESGILGNALNFSSSSSQLVNITNTAYAGFSGEENFSINAWIYPNRSAGDNTIIGKEKNWMLYQAGLKIYLYLSQGGGYVNQFYTTNNALNTGKWQMITVVYNGTGNAVGSSAEIYINGTSMPVTKGYTGGTFTNVAGQLNIGANNGVSDLYNGGIDELCLFNRTLLGSEVSEIYNSGSGLAFSSNPPGTITITLLSPATGTQTLNQSINFVANHSVSSSDINLTNTTIYLWYSNGTLFNSSSTNIIGNSSNMTTINISSIPFEDYVWNYNTQGVNSTGSIFSWAVSNFTLGIKAFSVNSETYNTSTYETKRESFSINISTIPAVSSIGAFLHYNGTAYAADHICSAGTCSIERTIDIPLITSGASQNKSFFWQITFFGSGLNSVTQNSTANSQNVTNASLIDCGGSVATTAVNFTIKNETTKVLTLADFKSTFSYYLGGGTVVKKYNYSGSGASSYDFCINNNLTFITSSEIRIENGTKIRNYLFNKEEYTNLSTEKSLFLPDYLTSNIIIDVKNSGLVPMANVLVNIFRFYPDENAYYKIESRVTDEFGQIVSKLVENDVSYKFEFYDSNNKLLKTSDKITVACRSSICILPFIIETSENYFERFNNLTLFSGSLLFDNTTNTFTFSWDDQRGEIATINLKVTRYNLNESTIICNNISVAKLATLVCSVGGQTASYTAQVFRTVNDKSSIISLLNVKIGDTIKIYGVEGLLWAFILLFTCIGLGAYNPTAGAVFFGFGFIFLGIMGLISMPTPVFFAVAVLVIVFIWAVNT